MPDMSRRQCVGCGQYFYFDATSDRDWCLPECKPERAKMPDELEYPDDPDDEDAMRRFLRKLHRSRHEDSDGYEEWREAVLEAAGYECERCGLTDEEHRERDDLFPPGGGLHAHHIKDAREFADPADAHTLDNGEALCADCHIGEVHDNYDE